ncbi:hypothetical protein COO60DRAFT_1486453 [Scenedesmus sp. NREL 46B-D3]|nr:hypothetical protein COO60DRAFT_1486453 [Scenedesmus sp. NREL 46B-D3]
MVFVLGVPCCVLDSRTVAKSRAVGLGLSSMFALALGCSMKLPGCCCWVLHRKAQLSGVPVVTVHCCSAAGQPAESLLAVGLTCSC